MIKVGVITVSDRVSRKEMQDIAGKKIQELIKKIDGDTVDYTVIPDEENLIEKELIRMADVLKLDLIITTGGTGLSRRDVTPDATLKVIEKEVPGICEIMRSEGFKTTPHAVLSRGVCGIRAKSLIINLPGSPKAVEECLGIIMSCLPHAIEILKDEGTDHTPRY